MPGSFFIDWSLRTGKSPSELEEMIENEPEWWRNRFWIYVQAGGR